MATDASNNASTQTETLTVNNAAWGSPAPPHPKGVEVVGKYLEWNPVACAAYYQVAIKVGTGSWQPWAKTSATDTNSTQTLIKEPGFTPDACRGGGEGIDSTSSVYSATVTGPVASPECTVPKLAGKTWPKPSGR
jgi:hypothetical protein